jgi:hypothetical protein
VAELLELSDKLTVTISPHGGAWEFPAGKAMEGMAGANKITATTA